MLGPILLSALLSSSEAKISECMDSIYTHGKHEDFDFEKCTGIHFDEIEIRPLDSLGTGLNLKSFRFKGFRDGHLVYSEKIIEGRLAFHIKPGRSRYKLNTYKFIIWSDKKWIPTNIMIIEKR
jgi:hypothetical protein